MMSKEYLDLYNDLIDFGKLRGKKKKRMMRPEPIEVFQRANITVRPSYRENTFTYSDWMFYPQTIEARKLYGFLDENRFAGKESEYSRDEAHITAYGARSIRD